MSAYYPERLKAEAEGEALATSTSQRNMLYIYAALGLMGGFLIFTKTGQGMLSAGGEYLVSSAKKRTRSTSYPSYGEPYSTRY